MILVFTPFPTVAQTTAMEINLVTGNEIGNYYAIGKDLEKLAKQKNLDIDVIPTTGALQNIHDVFFYESVPLGITQGDVLAFLSTFANNDEQSRVISESLRTVVPLYQEEIHLITRKDITSVEELAGKKLSIGDDGSGTATTASTLLFQWQIEPAELLTYDVKRAIAALREGEIDGMFYVVGTPAKVLEEQIFTDDNFHLLPISLKITSEDDFYNRLYSSAILPANTYSWQKEPVETLAVQSYLVTTDDQDCNYVSPVAKLIEDNLSWFQQNGDPVWQGVDLEHFHEQKPERVSQCSHS
jgi:TRAP transporter TAXI family solute receptor